MYKVIGGYHAFGGVFCDQAVDIVMEFIGHRI